MIMKRSNIKKAQPVQTDVRVKPTVTLIELRAAANGLVMSVWHCNPHSDRNEPRGYESYVIEGGAPDQIGRKIAKILKSYNLDKSVFLSPARSLP